MSYIVICSSWRPADRVVYTCQTLDEAADLMASHALGGLLAFQEDRRATLWKPTATGLQRHIATLEVTYRRYPEGEGP